MEIVVDVGKFGEWLRLMFGPIPPDAKMPEEMAWEDDGGPLVVRCEGYEHTIEAAA